MWLAGRPMVPAALAFLAGILLHDLLPAATLAYLIAAIGCVAGSLLARRALVRSLLMVVAFVFAGTAAAQLARYHYPPDHVARYAGDTPRLARLEGRLVGKPQLAGHPEGGRPRPPKMTGMLAVERVQTWDGWASSSGTVLLQIRDPDPRLTDGDRVRILGWLERPGRAMNPGQFDFAAYYRGRRVPGSLRTNGPGTIELIAEVQPSPLGKLRRTTRAALLQGFDADERDDGLLLRAMLLGQRDPAMDDDRELFRASGTGHFLAVSGLHVGIIAATALAIARLAGCGPRSTAIVCGGIVALYAAAAEPSPPVLRAAILAVGLGTGIIVGRRAGGVQLLALACLLLLAIFPLDVYRAGFQLSFVTVLALVLLATPARHFVQSAAGRPDDAVLADGDGRLIRLADWFDKRMLDGLSAAVVAWLASMPLVAVHFGQFNTWSIVASLVAAPLVVVSLLAGVAKVLLTLALPELAGVWATVASWPVGAMRGVVGFFSGLPMADVPLAVPPMWLIATIYASLFVAWFVARNSRTATLVWASRVPAALAVVAIFVMPLAGRATPTLADRPVRVTLLAVGAGQAAVIEQPTGVVTLVDAGSTSLADPWEACIGPFLRSRGIGRIDRLVISHANLDHFNAAGEIVRRYGVREVVIGPTFAADAGDEPAGRRMLAELKAADVAIRVVRRGDEVSLGARTSLDVLWPPANRQELSANDASLVASLSHEGRQLLFTGDIQAVALSELAGVGLPDVDVLVAPHHGSTESPTAEFVEACLPEWVVSSDSRRLSQKQRDLPGRLGGRPLLRTGQDGAILIDLAREGVTVTSHLQEGGRSLTVAE